VTDRRYKNQTEAKKKTNKQKKEKNWRQNSEVVRFEPAQPENEKKRKSNS